MAQVCHLDCLLVFFSPFFPILGMRYFYLNSIGECFIQPVRRSFVVARTKTGPRAIYCICINIKKRPSGSHVADTAMS